MRPDPIAARERLLARRRRPTAGLAARPVPAAGAPFRCEELPS